MAGYTRNDTSNNIATGNVINASDLDGEFDAIVAAFHASTGHVHDGTAANGAPITKVGPSQEYVGDGTSFSPKTTATYNLGTTSLRWNNAYIATLTLTNALTVANGGTGATTASNARTNLGLVIGTDVGGIGTLETWTASQRGTVTTDNDGSFDMNVTNNFKCTPTGTFTLTFTNITAGQSGYILLINSSGYAVSAASTTKVGSTFLATVSTAGTYLISYLSDGTNVYCTASGALS